PPEPAALPPAPPPLEPETEPPAPPLGSAPPLPAPAPPAAAPPFPPLPGVCSAASLDDSVSWQERAKRATAPRTAKRMTPSMARPHSAVQRQGSAARAPRLGRGYPRAFGPFRFVPAKRPNAGCRT